MGNCVFKGFGEVEEMIKVVTSNGGIMELYAPITAESITNEFPGHAIYRTCDFFSQPLLHNEELHAGELYYLLPLNKKFTKQDNQNTSNSSSSSSIVTPYRMSVDNQKLLKRTDAEILPRYNSSGVWKVKLVISPEQLAEILAQEARTEALIESVRTVAKCGNAVSSSVANSDQWSVSSSWKGSSEKHGIGSLDQNPLAHFGLPLDVFLWWSTPAKDICIRLSKAANDFPTLLES
ncbi:UvrABC system protein C [Melia azedarach]|uniref:UvrABC system protein C n=1 Tax=Melia azedarach TaxID=155640 RepID=A0ACC1YWB7_MELAZ|nr:UvrABC system protein C [Melia azedarach]